MIGSAEPRQSCEPLSVLICPEHDVSVPGSSFETALLKFKQHLIEGILEVGARLSQPFRDHGPRQQTLKPRDYPAVLDVHAQPPTTTEISNAQFGLLSREWALLWPGSMRVSCSEATQVMLLHSKKTIGAHGFLRKAFHSKSDLQTPKDGRGAGRLRQAWRAS